MADGGEGTVDALVSATRGTLQTSRVPDPLGKPVDAVWGLLGDGQTAVIEMAAASGLALVPPAQRDPRITTTRGTGELLRAALDRGVSRIILGIGGSATNDGGAGMAQALGYSLRDSAGKELLPGGAALIHLAGIDASQVHPRLAQCSVQVACDVTNPLCGPLGASHVYGPQKGATAEVAAALDAALAHFAAIVERHFDIAVADVPGAGAAGGLGAGLMAFAGGRLRSGVELVADACRLEDAVRGADLVITGEGRIDGQTIHGKTPIGVARIAKQFRAPVVAVAGSLGDGFRAVYEHGIDAVLGISPGPLTLEESMARAEELLRDAGESIAGMYMALRRNA